MGILKRIGVGLVAMLVILLGIGIFAKKEFKVNRQIDINQPKSLVFQYIKSLKNQDNFSKWKVLDPSMEKTYTGVDGTVGFVSKWKSNHPDVGEGEQEITAIAEGSRIDYQLRFKKPFEAVSTAYMSTEGNDQLTTVSWGFKGEMPFPMNLLLVFTDMEEDIANDLDQGLQNLKKQLE